MDIVFDETTESSVDVDGSRSVIKVATVGFGDTCFGTLSRFSFRVTRKNIDCEFIISIININRNDVCTDSNICCSIAALLQSS